MSMCISVWLRPDVPPVNQLLPMSPPQDPARIDAITGLRGLAALLVVYAHSVEWFKWPPGYYFSGDIGVMIFFALSGFLMAYLYLAKPFSVARLAEYGIHRFARIAPAYLFILLLSVLICAFVDPQFVYAITGQNLLRHILFSGDVSVFWSITPEVEFYFLFVLIWVATSRYAARANVAGLAMLAFALLLLMAFRDVFPGTFIASKLHYFLFGVIAGALRVHLKSSRLVPGRLNFLHGVLIVAIVLAVVLMVLGYGNELLPFENDDALYSSLLPAAFSAFLVFCFSMPSALGNVFFANKAIVLCGECSFSIYLLHMPVIYFFHKYFSVPLPLIWLLPFLLLIFGLAWLNYRLVERPGARLIKAAGYLFQRKFMPADARLRAGKLLRVG